MENRHLFAGSTWHSASSGPNCVEVARRDGRIGVRDSKLGGESPILTFSVEEWRLFLDGIKRGDVTIAV